MVGSALVASSSSALGGNLTPMRERQPPCTLPVSGVSQSASSITSSCEVLLRAKLSNVDGTACYMTAALLALLWSLYQDPTFNAGPLAVLYRHIALRPNAPLLKNLTWTAVLGNWAQPNRQHDMHELLLHIMPRLNPLEFQGAWQTRRLEETVIVICSSAATALPQPISSEEALVFTANTYLPSGADVATVL